MNEIIILLSDLNVITACFISKNNPQNRDIKTLSINDFNEFAQEEKIKSIKKKEKMYIIEYSNFNIVIQNIEDFIKNYPNSYFVKTIDYFENQKNRENEKYSKKVERKNSNNNNKIVALIMCGIMVVTGIKIIDIINEKHKRKNIISEQTTTEQTIASETTQATTEQVTIAMTTEKQKEEVSTAKEKVKETINSESEKKESDKAKIDSKNQQTKEKIDTSDYKEAPKNGFIITTNNKKYDISDNDYELLCAVVMQEGGTSLDEALAVTSVILNRCDAGIWGGKTPFSVITSPNQFAAYFTGAYKKFLNFNVPEYVKKAVKDCLNGIRNNTYCSFRSNQSNYYSENMVDSRGNRYK